MPYLKFEFSVKIDDDKIEKLLNFTKNKFSEIMSSGTDHIAISVTDSKNKKLFLGRVNNYENVCLMNFHIRKGRSLEQKNTIVSSIMDYVEKNIDIKTHNQYLTFTEHRGEDFNLYEKSLDNWKEGDDPLNE